MSSTEWAAILSATAAILAIMIGPLVQLRIAKLQVRASIVTAAHHEWLNKLRDAIAEYIGILTDIYVTIQFNGDAERLAELVGKAGTLATRIELLTNPNEENHRTLVGLVEKAGNLASQPGLSPESFKSKIDEMSNHLMRTSQDILKEVWGEVKALR